MLGNIIIGLMIALLLLPIFGSLYMYLDWRQWPDRCMGIGTPGLAIGIPFYDAFIPWTTPLQLGIFIGFVISAVLLFGGALWPVRSS